MLTTVRIQLEKQVFNFKDEEARIIYQPTEPGECPGYSSSNRLPVLITDPWDHPILDEYFDDFDEYPNMPRIAAEDDRFIYFPLMSSANNIVELVCVQKNLDSFLGPEWLIDDTPYFKV